MSSGNSWYTIKNCDEIDSPALTVHPDHIKENIREMIRLVGEDPDRLRPHVKTYKMIKVVQMQLDAGIKKFKCATIAEAEMLCMAGVSDILLAYQPVGPKISRLLELVMLYPEVSFAALIDNLDTAQQIDKACAERKLNLNLFLDLDTGNHRTGIETDNAYNLFDKTRELQSIKVTGLHAYDGHLRESSFEKRKILCDEAFKPVERLVKKIRDDFGIEMQIIAGGSPTFPVHAMRNNVICSPGTSLLWDWGYHTIVPDVNFKFGAVILTRLISKIGSTRICLDLGHKSIASENPFPRIHFLNLENARQVGHSEEHLVLEVEDNAALKIGQVFYGIPIHICPTVALYDKAHVIHNNMVTAQWKVIARDRSITV